MSDAPQIRLTGVSHVFETDDDEVEALRSCDLNIPHHQFLAIVGPSGCGKSTILRVIAGLLKPSRGETHIDDALVTGPSAACALVFQKPTLLAWCSIEDNLLFPIRLRRKITPADRAAAHDLLRLVELEGFAGRYPHELSGGMQQRAALCRALISEPQILLMDEPFAALDALTREELSLELLDLCRRQPKTVVFVTHSISEAVLLADRVVVMSGRPGRIIDDIPVSLPRPREFAMESEHAFQQCAQRIREHIFGARRRTGSLASA